MRNTTKISDSIDNIKIIGGVFRAIAFFAFVLCIGISSGHRILVTFCEREGETPAYDLGHGLIYGIDYYKADREAFDEIEDRICLKYSDDPEDAKGVANTFDISESGRLEIATTSRTLLVFDENKRFEYSVEFKISGDYGVLWAGENVALMNCRANSASILSDKGRLIGHYYINSAKNHDYWDDIVLSQERSIDGKTYSLDGVILAGPFSANPGNGYKSIIEHSPDGQDHIIYEWSEQLRPYDPYRKEHLVMCVILFFIFATGTYVIMREKKRIT